MKALELAKTLDTSFNQTHIYWPDVREAAAELRRLAEVNAELLDALEVSKNTLQYYASVCNEDDQETPSKYAIEIIDHASDKAKEQQ